MEKKIIKWIGIFIILGVLATMTAATLEDMRIIKPLINYEK